MTRANQEDPRLFGVPEALDECLGDSALSEICELGYDTYDGKQLRVFGQKCTHDGFGVPLPAHMVRVR